MKPFTKAMYIVFYTVAICLISPILLLTKVLDFLTDGTYSKAVIEVINE